ncbi:hypothetical protein [Carboxylicivirga marina]|uniref:hypothetical protein n=1 Tax=Carboxylicivirga marina TaxID=2800988 RepID=UPI00259361B7|nr:hypothetical protein [uncultured Carboxylicivirga sp.]
MNHSYNILKTAYLQNGYVFFDKGAYNLNIFGVRDSDQTADVFNDVIGVAYRDEFNNPVVIMMISTTDPGASFLGEKMGNSKGTAILQPGQYRHAWMLGQHKGRYNALVQSPKAQFHVWRDDNKDRCVTMQGPTHHDVSGLNCHTTSFIQQTEKVGAYSAGCQVVQCDKEFALLMALVEKSAEMYGNSFTYTLFNDFDF